MHINRFKVSGLCYKFCRTSPTKIASFTGLQSEAKLVKIFNPLKQTFSYKQMLQTDGEQCMVTSSLFCAKITL